MLDDNTISAGESNLKTNSVLYATEISSGNINSAGTVTAERVDVVDYVWASRKDQTLTMFILLAILMLMVK